MPRLSISAAFGCISVLTLLLIAAPARSQRFSPTDVVLNCTLTSSVDGPNILAAPRAINENFVVAFNDDSKRVTFIAGPLIRVEHTDERHREGELRFWDEQIATSGLTSPNFRPDRSYNRINVTLNRLPGTILVSQFHVFPDGRPAVLEYERRGTCVAGRRKF
jgi:hypothetical protein